MVSIFGYEGDSNAVIRDIKAGLEAAMYEEDISLPDELPQTGFNEPNIKIQKLVYRVTESKNLPIIRTWYRYGQFEPYAVLHPTNLEPQPLEKPEESAQIDDMRRDIPRREIKGFFIEEGISEDWKKPLFQFLKDNYVNYAPPKYKDTYISNTGILQVLEKMATDQRLEQNAGTYVDEIKPHTLDLRYELMENSDFDEQSCSHIEEFFRTFERCLIALDEMSDPGGNRIKQVLKGYQTYHEEVWPWPSMQISMKEATGPGSEIDQFTEDGYEYLDQFQSTFPEVLRSWQRQLSELDLRPTPTGYRNVRGSLPGSIGALEKAALDPSSDV